MEVLTRDQIYLSLFDDFGKTDNTNILIVAGSGAGKSLFMETIAEQFHECGYLVIFLTDVKDKFESSFAMFPPQERWHLYTIQQDARHLKRVSQPKEVEIYHPFTFSFPKKKMPTINLFTIPIKSLGMEEFSVIAETKMETTAIKLFFDTLKELKHNEGLSDLLFYASQKIEQKTKVSGTQLIRRPDPKNFYLKAPVSGTQKTISEISTFFRPYFYGNHYFFSSDNCSFNIDPMKIFKNQKAYHCLSTKYLMNEYGVKDEKIADMVQLNFYKTILRNLDKCKYPVLFVIDEIRKWLPAHSEGYKKYLIASMKDDFSTTRSKGKGVSTLCASQVYRDIAPEIAGSMSPNDFYIGQTSDTKDIESYSTSLRLTSDEVRQIRQLPRNCYIKKTQEGSEVFHALTPQHCHAEPHYDFIEMYAQKCPEKMKYYSEEIDVMAQMKKDEDERIKTKSNMVIEEETIKTKQLQERRKDVKLKKMNQQLPQKMYRQQQRKNDEVMKGVSIELAKKWKDIYINEGKSYYEIAKMYGLTMKNGEPYAVKIQMSINKLNQIQEPIESEENKKNEVN